MKKCHERLQESIGDKTSMLGKAIARYQSIEVNSAGYSLIYNNGYQYRVFWCLSTLPNVSFASNLYRGYLVNVVYGLS